MNLTRCRLFVTVLLMLITLTACAGGGESVAPEGQSRTTGTGTPQISASLERDLSVRSPITGLTKALREIAPLYRQAVPGINLDSGYASPDDLEAAIAAGDRPDIYIAGTPAQMDSLESSRLIRPDSRCDLLSNALVLVVPADSGLEINDLADLTSDNITRVAIGDPSFVAAGEYALEALDELGLRTAVEPKLIFGSEGYSTLTRVESGYAQAGLVYYSDAVSTPRVRIIAFAPPGINDRIIYPAAVLSASADPPAACDLLDFLMTEPAGEIFDKYGFGVFNQK